MIKSLKFAWDTFKGSNRSSNKDGVSILQPDKESGNLFVVFDGVSSLMNAKHGVNIAKKFLEYNAFGFYDENHNYDLTKLALKINNKLYSSNFDKPYSTCIMLYVEQGVDANAKAVSIGDSRIYKLTNQYIEQLTKDDKDDVESNIITKYLGMPNDMFEDVFEFNINITTNEKILMCTDGFYEVMNKNKIEFIKAFNKEGVVKIRESVNKLIEGNNNDDATYILIGYEDV